MLHLLAAQFREDAAFAVEDTRDIREQHEFLGT
jgi:hypothetical protein